MFATLATPAVPTSISLVPLEDQEHQHRVSSGVGGAPLVQHGWRPGPSAGLSVVSLAAGATACGHLFRRRKTMQQGRGRQRTQMLVNEPPGARRIFGDKAPRDQAESLEIDRIRSQLVKTAMEVATPVPEDFDQAVRYAISALLKAYEAGYERQLFYFNSGEGTEKAGELGKILEFTGDLAKLLCLTDELKDGMVKVVCNDIGSSGVARAQWEPLPPSMTVEHLPILPPFSGPPDPASKAKLASIIDGADFIFVAAPTQDSLPALKALCETMNEFDVEVPMALINPVLGTSRSLGSERDRENDFNFMRSFFHVFHMEHISLPETEEVNEAVMCRAYPLPFSLWEDNPDDPEAVDGFFLIDVSTKKPRKKDDIVKLLRASKEYFQWALEEQEQEEKSN